MNKLICIDYDGTYTAMPELLDAIIAKAKDLGYTVILATMRYECETDLALQSLIAKVDQAIFTSRKAKLPFLRRLNIRPDIWIDDNPQFLLIDDCRC